MLHRHINILAVSLALLALAGCFGPQFKASKTLSQSTPHITGAPISVKSVNGSVEVIADSSVTEVQIIARITCSGETQAEADKRLDATQISVTRDTAGLLTIAPRFPGQRLSNEGVSLTVRLPDASGVTAVSSNGSVRLKGLSGAADIRTSNAGVNVTDHVGPTTIHTSNGAVEIVNHDGTVSAYSSNGSMSVALAPSVTGPVDLSTSNASIQLVVGSAFAGVIECDTSNASVQVNAPGSLIATDIGDRTERVITLVNRGESSRLRSSNGSIRVTIRP